MIEALYKGKKCKFQLRDFIAYFRNSSNKFIFYL